MRRLLLALLVLLAIFAALVWAGGLGLGPLVIAREGEQKMVLFFGEPVAVLREPGLGWRVPLLTQVLTFDRRLLYLNIEPSDVPTRNQERLVVDSYVIWRISDPQQFYESFRGDLARAQRRIGDVIIAELRAEIGRRTIPELLTEKRVEIMAAITRSAQSELTGIGIEVADVRINRTELPEATIENVYARMRSEREQLARKYRAEGEEEGRSIRAAADRDARVTIAEAQRDSEIARGEGDARAAGIYAQAYQADAEFYAFVRSLEAYRKTIGEGTTLVVPPDSAFFKAFQDPGTERRPSAPPPAPAPPAAGP